MQVVGLPIRIIWSSFIPNMTERQSAKTLALLPLISTSVQKVLMEIHYLIYHETFADAAS